MTGSLQGVAGAANMPCFVCTLVVGVYLLLKHGHTMTSMMRIFHRWSKIMGSVTMMWVCWRTKSDAGCYCCRKGGQGMPAYNRCRAIKAMSKEARAQHIPEHLATTYHDRLVAAL
jgi:hypothetical protein